ncbi:MAG: ABC transporter ATP-binding protein [Anaeroplasma sp.]
MIAIKINNITKEYEDIIAVDNVSLEIEKGLFFGLLGVNGAGKTTLIKMLTGLLTPTSGDAYINDKSIITDIDYVKQIVNSSPQETAIAPNLSVYENLEFIAMLYGVNKDEAKIRITEIGKKLGLEKVFNKKSAKLSGGWQRRLSIAMALITEPEVLILDEPTLGLDVIARRELWDIIKQLKGKITIILTTHYLEEVEALCDRIAIMANGKIKKVGTKEELITWSNSNSFEDAFIKYAREEII